MKYFWDIKDIRSKMYKANTSDTRRYKIYKNMLADFSVSKKVVFTKIDKELFFSELDNFDITYFDNSIFKLVNYISVKMDGYDVEFKTTLREKRNPDYIVKTCKDFYKRNDKDSFTYFKKIIQNEDRIQFVDRIDKDFMGRVYFLGTADFYILVNGRNYIEDSLSLIHESKHVELKLKGYDKGIAHYQELASILYEFYMTDYLLQTDDNKPSVSIAQMRNLDKYVRRIRTISEAIETIKRLRSDKNYYENIKENYDLYYSMDHLDIVYSILNNGVSEKEIGNIISFIVALDIYLKSRINNVNNVLSCYIFGIYKLKPSIVDNLIEYLTSMYRPYISDEEVAKNKKLQKLY